MTTSTSSNRAVTLAGANKIFSVAGIEISHNPLGFYQSTGAIELQKPTLTELCQAIVSSLVQASTATK